MNSPSAAKKQTRRSQLPQNRQDPALNLNKVDAILLDLGVSSMQLDRPEKGFSFMREGPLDMRMDPDASLSALEVVNEFSEAELGRIFRDCGEEKQWRAAARLTRRTRTFSWSG